MTWVGPALRGQKKAQCAWEGGVVQREEKHEKSGGWCSPPLDPSPYHGGTIGSGERGLLLTHLKGERGQGLKEKKELKKGGFGSAPQKGEGGKICNS